MTDLVIRSATLEETDTVIRILNEAAEWLTAREIAGWKADQWKRAKLEAAIARKETFLAFEADRAIGTRDLGKRYLRLDCACASAGLRAYYAAAGFGWRGDRTVRGATDTWCGALFEKAL